MIEAKDNHTVNLTKSVGLATLDLEEGHYEQCINRLNELGLFGLVTDLDNPLVFEGFNLYAKACVKTRNPERLLVMLNLLEKSHISCMESFKPYFDDAA